MAALWFSLSLVEPFSFRGPQRLAVLVGLVACLD
jgi:hypothetical protein